MLSSVTLNLRGSDVVIYISYEESELINMTPAWGKEKYETRHESSPGPPDTERALYPLSYLEIMDNKVI